MKTLYQASNAVEAHMILDLLKQEGLSAQIHGEYLQGAIGELPAAGLVRLVIDESDFAQAHDLIERWEATQVKETSPQTPQSTSKLLYGLLLGLILGIGCAYLFFYSPISTDGIDYNGDGILDEKWTFSPKGRPTKTETDRNLDGRVDYVVHFDRHGLMASIEADDDFDGVFETRGRFQLGNMEITEVDTDGDGYPDLRSFYAQGVSTSTQFINPATGLPLRVESYKLGITTMAEVDTNKDGKLDTRYIYSPLGEVISSEKISR